MAVLQQGRQGTAGEAIDGITPRLVAEPSSGAACAAVLAAAAAGRVPTVVRGGGTKSGWGRPVDAVDGISGRTGAHGQNRSAVPANSAGCCR